MAPQNDGKEFERLTAEVFEILSSDRRFVSVEKDVWLDGKDGKRQIDILITADLGATTSRTIVECRDLNNPINVTHVDGLHSKLMDVHCHQAVLVTRLGYSNKAKRKADRVGIVLFTLSEALESGWHFACPTPICIQEISTSSFRVLSHITGMDETISQASFKKLLFIFDVEEYFRRLVIERKIATNFAGVDYDPAVDFYEPLFLNVGPFEALFVLPPDPKEKCYRTEELTIRFAFRQRLYFAYLDELIKISKVSLNNVLEEKERVFLKAEMLPGFSDKFNVYSKIEELPVKPRAIISAVVLPFDRGRYFFRSRVPISLD